jgi:rhamnosyl/mannosyltransferase
VNSEQFTADRSLFTILFLGRHRHYKGVDVLIRSMAQVDNARLLIGGTGVESDNWKALTTELGLNDCITFLGDIPESEKAQLYKQADIFVLPAVNRAEAFGIVLLEAMASGLPCVTSELGTGTSFVVQDGQTGIVVPPSQPAALADALNRLLQNPTLRQQMGASGRQRVLTEFTIERMVERIEQVYLQLLS